MCLLAVLLVCGLSLQAPVTGATECEDLVADLQLELARQQKTIDLLIHQTMSLQLSIEESIRSEGHSGIKQVRDQNMELLIHDHANYINTVGMGEFVAVLNGVEFRTRHKDYKLVMSDPSSDTYHKTEDIRAPSVPPEVLKKRSVEDQIAEMKEFFIAFRDQNETVRNYTEYFKPVLCYLEGAWTTGELEEPFDSERHSLNATDWKDLQEQIRYTSYSGGKNSMENLAYLPSTIMKLNTGTPPETAQWNYRILCHPLKEDLPTNRLHIVDDLATRMAYKRDMNKKPTLYELGIEGHAPQDYLEELMGQIPGLDQKQGNLEDHTWGDLVAMKYRSKKEKLNTAYYHRSYSVKKQGTDGLQERHRGFSDDTVFMAMTTQKQVAGMETEVCKNGNCSKVLQRWSYAIPLEIIYLTPLSTWNPYDIEYKGLATSTEGKTVWANGRNGGHSPEDAYDGVNSATYYLTPEEFFTDDPALVATNGPNKPKGVLDRNGQVRHVRGSGTRVSIPVTNIGSIRQRYPIFPVRMTTSALYQELSALRDVVMEPSKYASTYPFDEGQWPVMPPSNNAMEVILEMKSPRSNEHTHYIFLAQHQVKDLHQGEALWVVTSVASYPDEDFHTHDLEIVYDGQKYWFIRCDDGETCADNHPPELMLARGPLEQGYMP